MKKGLEINLMQEVEGISALQIAGRLDSSSAIDFEEVFSSLYDKLQAQGGRYLIVSFENLNYINSMGLTALVRMIKKYMLPSGQSGLILCSINTTMMRLLNFTGLLKIVPVYQDIPHAYAEMYNTNLNNTGETL